MKSPLVRSLVRLAIEEDLSGGDVTTDLLIEKSAKGEGIFIAKEPFIFCDGGILSTILEEYRSNILIKKLLHDGSVVKRGETLGIIEGSLRDLLSIERTALNFLQRLSGVATYTSSVVKKAKGITVLDTRKTLPGYRTLDKYAVTIGGGKNHRRSLSDMVLIKNNHIDALKGGITEALTKGSDRAPSLQLEVEVRNFKELESALTFSPDWIMLDNMSNREIERALKLISKIDNGIRVEISGGVTPERLPSLKSLGVKYVSMGSLTTQAPNVDISLRIQKKTK